MAKDYPKIAVPPPGPRARAVIERDSRVMSQNHAKDYPLVAERGQGAMVEDVDGNRYLDFAAGIAVVATGHCHPEVVAAIQRQAERFLHMCATDFYYENVVALAEGLARRAPGPGPWRVFFANSGAETVEAAIKLARLRTGRSKVVSFYGAFHGRTYGAMSLTASKPVQRRGYGPFLPEVLHSHYAYCYRCPVNRHPDTCGIECLDLLTETMFGTTRLLEGGLVQNAESVGGHLIDLLRRRLGGLPVVGDVRGLGLMIGVEIVKDRTTREPAPDLREKILEEAFRRGLLLLGCGKSTIRLAPPLIIDREDAEVAVGLLEEAIRALA